jgi:endonuclease V-like protein UPF0215 family
LELEFRRDLEQLEQEGQMPYISSIERMAKQEEIESLLEAKFGEVDQVLRQIINPLMQLSPSDRAQLILQLSRDELIARLRPLEQAE